MAMKSGNETRPSRSKRMKVTERLREPCT